MTIDVNRWGLVIVTARNTVISLGWNVWGYDRADGSYFIAHLFPPRLFRSR